MGDQALAIDALKKVDQKGNDVGCTHFKDRHAGCKYIPGDGYPKVIHLLQKDREIRKEEVWDFREH